MDARWIGLLIISPYLIVGFLLLAPAAAALRRGRLLVTVVILLLAVLVVAAPRILLNAVQVSSLPGSPAGLAWP